ncbi:MAG: hypothetical protein GYB65_00965 [Chloroflexi bacterium]|nr:hypothetical protein [Chloroflexota bacterium]
MKHKPKHDKTAYTGRIPATAKIDFVSKLSVEDCLQRLHSLTRTRLSHGRAVDVVTIDNHFTISVFIDGPDASGWRVARCIGDLKPLPDGTRVLAQVKNFQTIGFEHGFIFLGWAAWVIYIMVMGSIKGGALISTNTLTWGLFTCWMPIAFHLGLRWDIRSKRRQSVDFSRWLYTILFEYTVTGAETATTTLPETFPQSD